MFSAYCACCHCVLEFGLEFVALVLCTDYILYGYIRFLKHLVPLLLCRTSTSLLTILFGILSIWRLRAWCSAEVSHPPQECNCMYTYIHIYTYRNDF